MTTRNRILSLTDSYKTSQWRQYPPGTEIIHSYIEARGTQIKMDRTLFAGLQAFIKEYLLTPVTMAEVREAGAFCKEHGVPFNEEGWVQLIHDHNGYFPVSILAVPEGTLVPTHNVLLTIENTDPDFFWVTSYIETGLLRAIWYMTTVASISREIKEICKHYLEISADNLNGLPFMLNDFGARGVSSLESAELGGIGHLINFMGTDNMAACLAAKKYYRAASMPGFSIPAMEHSTVTSWGRDHEADAYENMLTHYAHEGKIVAMVADSYDIFNAAEHIFGEQLKERIIKSGARVVIRPDSGNPVDVVARVVCILDKQFGSVVNSKGFKVLNYVRVIQGDGINADSIREILARLIMLGYSADNVVFGMGGALLQGMNRDTFKFAMKCSAARIRGKWVDVYKDPVTDFVKKSKRGRQMLWVTPEGQFITDTLKGENVPVGSFRALQEVYRNGMAQLSTTFEQVRKRSDMTTKEVFASVDSLA